MIPRLISLFDWTSVRIRNKILFSVLAVFVLIYGATLSYVYNRIKVDLLESARTEALSTTQMLAVTLWREHEIENDSREIQGYIVGTRKIKTNLLQIDVLDRNLTVISSTEEDNLFETAVGETYRRALENTSYDTLLIDEPEPYINIVYPVSAGPGDNYAVGIVETKSSLKAQFDNLARIRINTIGAGVGLLIGITVVITLISQTITRPIHTLFSGMSRANEGDLNVQVPVVSRDEVGYLTSTFNDMLNSIRISNERILAMMESSRRFVPDQFLSALGRSDITDVQLGDAILRDMTVFFMDIRGFTDMSEHMSADENLVFLNSLMAGILPAIEKHHGFIDKYMGDAVMALFPEKPDNALLAALDLRARVLAFSQARQKRGDSAIDVGVGINFGELILGTMGSDARMDTTVIGSTVNLASRLASLTKEYSVPIILPEDVLLAMDESTRIAVRSQSLGSVKIRGIEGELKLVGVLGLA